MDNICSVNQCGILPKFHIKKFSEYNINHYMALYYTRFMNKSAYAITIIMITSILSGCIGSEEPNEPDDAVKELTIEEDVRYAKSFEDLPNCDSNLDGRLYYVDLDKTFYVCLSFSWNEIDLTGPIGEQGIQGIIGDQGNSYLIETSNGTTCADGGIQFLMGIDLDGNEKLNGAELKSIIEICNGERGFDGLAGINGTDGLDGINGTDGLDGIDGADGEDGINGTDGLDGADGVHGTDGEDGYDGLNALVRTSSQNLGSNCNNDGIKIESGLDNNYDGILGSSEIAQTQYICNGESGADAADGAD